MQLLIKFPTRLSDYRYGEQASTLASSLDRPQYPKGDFSKRDPYVGIRP